MTNSPYILLRERDGVNRFGALTYCAKEPCYRFDFAEIIRAKDLPKFGTARRFTGEQIARLLGETK